MQNKFIMRYPTSWHGEMWREGAPCGNGVIGALVYGSVYSEKILLNHCRLWRGGNNDELPDISYCLPEIRRLLDEHKAAEADAVFSSELRKKGYKGDIVSMIPMCDININTEICSPLSHYRRIIDMEKAVVTVKWSVDDVNFTRSTFVSRADDTIFTRYTSDKPKHVSASISLNLHDTETKGNVVIDNPESYVKGDKLYYTAHNSSVYNPADGDYGAVGRVITDGVTSVKGNCINVTDASEILIVTKLFVGGERNADFERLTAELDREFDYDRELERHAALHTPLFNGVNFEISSPTADTSNEQLLLDAFDGEASNEFIEKMYAYGRYLFICATSDSNTLPCHLTGLWAGSYAAWWVIYMYNVNFEMIYWQSLSGNLPSFLRLALDYTESLLDDFRTNARNMYGCRGIWINSVNTPESGLSKCLSNHILNWTAGAAWFAQHFWDYYRFTCDTDYLRDHALPFMYEAALFYEDFMTLDADGYYEFSPSVSPENTPANIKALTGRQVETAKNAVMDIASVKELLTNLISGCEITGQYTDKVETWKNMLAKLPPYTVNTDGAVKEWNDSFYADNYEHRHQSQLYPVFPGCEVDKTDPLYPAFVKAEELRFTRGLKDQSSWSAVNMACTFARMEQGDTSLKVLETIGAATLMNNFFTLHNDWRRMGQIMCDDLRAAPFQIDANTGFPAAVNEMLLQSQHDDIFVLPALPSKWKKGKIKGLLARGNIVCNIKWSRKGGKVTFKLNGESKVKSVKLGSGYTFKDGSNEKVMEIYDGLSVKFICAL